MVITDPLGMTFVVVLWILSSGDVAGMDVLGGPFVSLLLKEMEEDEEETVLPPSME